MLDQAVVLNNVDEWQQTHPWRSRDGQGLKSHSPCVDASGDEFPLGDKAHEDIVWPVVVIDPIAHVTEPIDALMRAYIAVQEMNQGWV